MTAPLVSSAANVINVPATVLELHTPRLFSNDQGVASGVQKRENLDLYHFLINGNQSSELKPKRQRLEFTTDRDISAILPIRTTTVNLSMFYTTKEMIKGGEKVNPLYRQLERSFGMPRQLWAKPYWESNGYFGCRDRGGFIHNTWFFFLAKQIIEKKGSEAAFPKEYDYVWYKMGFFSTWTRSNEGPKSILCFNCPKEMISDIEAYLGEYLEDFKEKSLGNLIKDPFNCDPYSFHQTVLHGIVHVYDRSVWKIKDIVRAVEKDRSADTDYHSLHEAARHIIHSTETLTSANELMGAMIDRHHEYSKLIRENFGTDPEIEYLDQTKDHLIFHRTVLFGIKSRSQSLQSRHTNEISLALNLVTALDTKFMKAIAVLTVIFLPATTIATIFGMSFFNYNPSDISSNTSGYGFDDGEWSISHKFWIFWAWAIPCTVAVPLFFVRDLFKSIHSSYDTLRERFTKLVKTKKTSKDSKSLV